MVRVWAEKEMRNLKRLHSAGIRCPEPLEVRENVLVMGFIGDKEGWYVRLLPVFCRLCCWLTIVVSLPYTYLFT